MEASKNGSIVAIPVSIKVLNATTIVTADHVQVSGFGLAISDAYKNFCEKFVDAICSKKEEIAFYEFYWPGAAATYCDVLCASILRRDRTIEQKFRDSEELDALLHLMSPEDRHHALARSWSKICRWRHRHV